MSTVKCRGVVAGIFVGWVGDDLHLSRMAGMEGDCGSCRKSALNCFSSSEVLLKKGLRWVLMEIQISFLIPIQRTGISFHHLEPPVAFSLAEWFGNKKQAHHTRPHIGKYLQYTACCLLLSFSELAKGLFSFPAQIPPSGHSGLLRLSSSLTTSLLFSS